MLKHDSKRVLVTDEDKEHIKNLLQNNVTIPCNFIPTVPFYESNQFHSKHYNYQQNGDPQTDAFLKSLHLDHVVTIPYQEGLNNTGMLHQVDVKDEMALLHDDNIIELDESGDEMFQNNHTEEQKCLQVKRQVVDENEIHLDDDIENSEDNTK